MSKLPIPRPIFTGAGRRILLPLSKRSVFVLRAGDGEKSSRRYGRSVGGPVWNALTGNNLGASGRRCGGRYEDAGGPFAMLLP